MAECRQLGCWRGNMCAFLSSLYVRAYLRHLLCRAPDMRASCASNQWIHGKKSSKKCARKGVCSDGEHEKFISQLPRSLLSFLIQPHFIPDDWIFPLHICIVVPCQNCQHIWMVHVFTHILRSNVEMGTNSGRCSKARGWRVVVEREKCENQMPDDILYGMRAQKTEFLPRPWRITFRTKCVHLLPIPHSA